MTEDREMHSGMDQEQQRNKLQEPTNTEGSLDSKETHSFYFLSTFNVRDCKYIDIFIYLSGLSTGT